MRIHLLASLLLLIALPQPSAAVDLERLVQRCGRGQCQQTVNQEFRDITRNIRREDQRDEEIALIGLALYTVARKRNSRVVRARVATALVRLAAASPNPDQARLFRTISRAIRRGDTDLFNVVNPFAASPS